MSDPITDHIERILIDSEHGLAPLHELYQRLSIEGLMSWTDYDVFFQLVATDGRFEIIQGLGDSELLDEVMQDELEMRGLLGGPRVVLRSRMISPKIVMQDLLQQLQEMNEALEDAWKLRPLDDPSIETELVHLLMMGDMLERELQLALNADAHPHSDANVRGTTNKHPDRMGNEQANG